MICDCLLLPPSPSIKDKEQSKKRDQPAKSQKARKPEGKSQREDFYNSSLWDATSRAASPTLVGPAGPRLYIRRPKLGSSDGRMLNTKKKNRPISPAMREGEPSKSSPAIAFFLSSFLSLFFLTVCISRPRPRQHSLGLFLVPVQSLASDKEALFSIKLDWYAGLIVP